MDISERIEDILRANPYNFDACNVLIDDLQNHPIEDARHVYDKLISRHPNSVKVWTKYIEHEMKFECYDEIGKLFQRCLMNIVHVDIWKLYLNFVKRSKKNSSRYVEPVVEQMVKTYDFVLEKIGVDINSYPIWKDYVEYLTSLQANGSFADGQKISAIRNVYHNGLKIPMVDADKFWKDYCNFENMFNPTRKVPDEKDKEIILTRKISKEIEKITKRLNRKLNSEFPSNSPEEIKQLELWKEYINFEKSNPLKSENQIFVTKRVMYIYEQCFLSFGLHPDVWISAAQYLEKSRKCSADVKNQTGGKITADEVSQIYERAISSGLENCLLIYFAYADLEESRMNHEKVHDIYKRALELHSVETTLIYIQYMRFARRSEGVDSSRKIFRMARNDYRSKYQVYVAAAKMECYCSNDNRVAMNIFELGFNKFSNQFAFLKEFIEFSINTNDYKNTKSLFERVLACEIEPKENLQEMWKKYVEFEINVGGLVDIMESEERRSKVLGQNCEGREASVMVDRYTCLDLLPCSSVEFKSFSLNFSTNIFDNSSIKNKIESKINVDDSKIPKAIVSFMNVLPSNFRGPFVIIDQFINNLFALQIPDTSPPQQQAVSNKNSTNPFNTLKRKSDESDDGDGPLTNLFMSRLQKKCKS